MGESGARLTVDRESRDVTSTSWPGWLSTLLFPLVRRRLGVQAPKLGIPGRPAGAIDALGTATGDCTEMSTDEMSEVLATTGYARPLAGRQWAQLDARLFPHVEAVRARPHRSPRGRGSSPRRSRGASGASHWASGSRDAGPSHQLLGSLFPPESSRQWSTA